jgi:hypothetical protein
MCFINYEPRDEGIWKCGGSIIFISSLIGGDWPFLRLRQLYPGESVARIHCIVCTPEPTSSLWSREISLSYAGNGTLAIQPVTERYTDYGKAGINEVPVDVRISDWVRALPEFI